MPPTSSLAALMQSPMIGSDSTILAHGKTLPDVSLDSLGSSFRSEDEERNVPSRLGVGGLRPQVSRLPTLPTTDSPDTSRLTPSPPPAAALIMSPPSTVRRSSSNSILERTPGTQAPRRSRILRSQLTGSVSSVSSSDAGQRAGRRYPDTDDETDATGVLASLNVNITPRKGGKSYAAGPSKRDGRQSAAAEGLGPKTLREQEQELDAVKKDNFNLQLENHFLKERLGQMAPDHIEAALKENVKLKLEILNLSKETKKIKKLLLQQDRDLNDVQREREGQHGTKGELKELERLYKEEKDRRTAAEKELASKGAGGADGDSLRAQMEDVEASENVWRQRCEQLEEEVEHLKGSVDDLEQDLAAEQERADRAEDGGAGTRDLEGDTTRRRARMQDLEEENARLIEEIEALRRGGGGSVVDELEDRLNEMQDRLAAAQLDLDKRDQEIDELNAELDARLRDHEKEIGQVAAEWKDEVLEARAQVDELRDVLEAREQDVKELREVVQDREEHLHSLEAEKAETADRLEDTLKNIERDNSEKEADLIAANREVEELGQRVYELEEMADELKARETDLNADLRSADEAFENSKTHYESLVSALKDARRKLQSDLADEQERHQSAVERLERDLQDRETLLSRTKREVEDARERVAMRDKDLAKVQNMLRGLEDERRKIGDEATSDKFGLELEMDCVRRDLRDAEGELEDAREALGKRDMEYSAMLDRQRELQDTLSAERQARLNMSDKLDDAMKSAKKYEREAHLLRERIEELEPLLTETQQERFALQKQNETQRQERSELLLRVFKDVNRFLGTEDHTTPAQFNIFRETLLKRLNSMNGVRTDFEKRIKETETSVDQRMAGLKRQLEQKWRTLDTFEASVKKLELAKMSWRGKYQLKEGELEAAKTRIADLTSQLSSERAGSSSTSNSNSSQLRALTDRAERAERRAQTSQNQLAQLEAKVAEMQQRAGQAENKWEARVKEYENRLRIAGEKIKTEKQGGKERAIQLEGQIRELERQIDGAKKRNTRAEGVVATASHLMPGRSASGQSNRGRDSFGTATAHFQQECSDALVLALDKGFRYIDTAIGYGNEQSIGTALTKWKGRREDVFICSKWGWSLEEREHNPERDIEQSLEQIGVDYLDLYLIHLPNVPGYSNAEAWKKMEEIQKKGFARSIGISNFKAEHIEELSKVWTIKPSVNQIEFHPYCFHDPRMISMAETCKKYDIAISPFSPLASINRFPGGPVDEVVLRIGEVKGITPAQVLLAWARQRTEGGPVVTTASKEWQYDQTLASSEVELSNIELQEIDEAGRRGGIRRSDTLPEWAPVEDPEEATLA